MDVETLIDNAVGLPSGSRVNFYVLNALLKCFAIKLQMSKDDISLYLGAETGLKIRKRLFGGAEEEFQDENEELLQAAEEELHFANEPEPMNEELQSVPETENETDGAIEATESAANVAVGKEEGGLGLDDTINLQSESSEMEFPNEADQQSIGVIPDLAGSSSTIIFSNETIDVRRSVEDKKRFVPSLDIDGKLSFSDLHLGTKTEVADTLLTSAHLSRFLDKSEFELFKQDLNPNKVKEIVETFNFILQSILTMIDMKFEKSNEALNARRLMYLKSKLSGHALNLSSSENQLPLPMISNTDITKLVLPTQKSGLPLDDSPYITEKKLMQHEVIREIKNNEKLMFLKVDALSVRFLERNFEEEYERLHEVAERGKKFLNEFRNVEARIGKNSDRLTNIENTIVTLTELCNRLEECKIDASQIKQILGVKPDFGHLNKKLSVVEFVQYKYFLEENFCCISKTLEDFQRKLDVAQTIADILDVIQKADWVNQIRLEVESNLNDFKKEIMGIFESKQACNTLGIPLMYNLPHSLPTKKDHGCDNPQKQNYYTPSINEIQKTCLQKLSKGNQPFKMPTANILYKGTTSKLVKRSSSEPRDLKLKFCSQQKEKASKP